jgi:thiol-disulfide isomerase/thioredoxin
MPCSKIKTNPSKNMHIRSLRSNQKKLIKNQFEPLISSDHKALEELQKELEKKEKGYRKRIRALEIYYQKLAGKGSGTKMSVLEDAKKAQRIFQLATLPLQLETNKLFKDAFVKLETDSKEILEVLNSDLANKLSEFTEDGTKEIIRFAYNGPRNQILDLMRKIKAQIELRTFNGDRDFRRSIETSYNTLY